MQKQRQDYRLTTLGCFRSKALYITVLPILKNFIHYKYVLTMYSKLQTFCVKVLI